ncbi:polyphosphate kinase [Pedobacter sp. PACM 27299]|uniref:polyphosphate kinase 1 n=1 Tax=Pedobacter sp. PACM 27299 TaxID=1727164 RepID=UPI000705F615|nr:polyphosphate kinase 1 [Pedobacter sp. PACM 27299]ALL07255.1 polyphosphate kinase [Pedobacter sp. PACM 27299]
MDSAIYFNRDLSWLSFNERVLMEASRAEVPILERIRFLSIYSSNLDEFYRVRMPVMMWDYELAKAKIDQQQQRYGEIISQQILPALEAQQVYWLYNKPIPAAISEKVTELFFNEVLAYIHAECIDHGLTAFFAENNKLYQVVILKNADAEERMELISIPSEDLQRLYAIPVEGAQYVVFLEDIIKYNLAYLFPNDEIQGAFNLKITRNAALKIGQDYSEDMTIALEKELEARDFGFATRFLFEPGLPLRNLYRMIYALNLQKAAVVQGGAYHNLKDLNAFPLDEKLFGYPKWPASTAVKIAEKETIFDHILRKDILVNVPYQNYNAVLRFFNEASNDVNVTEVYVTLYRVARNSRIVNALMTAAKNGKKVVVLVELKARFDEANNIKWAKQMKAAGVKIIYSSIDLKVHAKVALVKRTINGENQYLGLLATGNLNESTAKFYTDHILLTAHQPMLQELESLFDFLSRKDKTAVLEDPVEFNHLLVAQFNLHQRFLGLIQREMDHVQQGLPAGITLKLNNLEEQVLIAKLYEASQAGVKIQLIIRGICCLVPGKPGLSENITVRRIVDRFLEHGRVFIFDNNGQQEIYMGSADWMNRNIYSRIEVCFPLYDADLKRLIQEIITLQLQDNVQAVNITAELENEEINGSPAIRSQEAIYQFLQVLNN